MEPAIQTEDLKNKIEDFNAITQNTNNETAKTFLEMCHNDLNVNKHLITKFLNIIKLKHLFFY